MPVHQTAVGKEAKKLTNVFEKRVLKEVQRYEHRIFQEMDPETAEQLQQSENEVSGSGGVVVVRCGSPLFLLFSALVCQLILLSVVCLPHAPQKVARLRDTLSGLRKQIDSEKGI